jgi:hypothetical protein
MISCDLIRIFGGLNRTDYSLVGFDLSIPDLPTIFRTS